MPRRMVIVRREGGVPVLEEVAAHDEAQLQSRMKMNPDLLPLDEFGLVGPLGAEVYVDDERRASVGSSGKVVLTDIPAGRHILRVSKPGERDDERVRPLHGMTSCALRSLRSDFPSWMPPPSCT